MKCGRPIERTGVVLVRYSTLHKTGRVAENGIDAVSSRAKPVLQEPPVRQRSSYQFEGTWLTRYLDRLAL